MFDYSKIPNELKNEKRWVLWKLKKDDKGRLTKIPINAMNGYFAKSNDSRTWTTFNNALNKINELHCKGLGLMLGNGIFGVDIDHALDDKNLIDEFVKKLDSYTEVSQSGNGIHIICRGYLPKGARRKNNIEMYDSTRFFAMTGNVFDNHCELNERTEEVKELFNKYLNNQEPKRNTYVYHEIPKTTINDDDILKKASNSSNGNLFMNLYNGNFKGFYKSQSDADMALCNMLAFWCGNDITKMDRLFRNSALYREKWDEKRGELTYGEITLNKAIARNNNVYDPNFNKNKISDYVSDEKVEKKIYDLNDTGNAMRFIDRFGENIRYNFDNKYWLFFNSKTWVKDEKQVIKKQADIMIEEMKEEAKACGSEEVKKEILKNIKHLSSNSGKEAMLKEAMHLNDTAVINSDFDNDNYLLNCANGIVDLRTGKITPHDKSYMMSKNTNVPVDMNNEPKRFIQFIHEIFNNDEEMVEYIQKAIGYTLTGETNEQCFFQCYGDGANGKSVLLDIIYEMMGDYAVNSQIESILAKNTSGGANSEIARMNGARLVRTNEPNENSRFNEGLVKQLVSGDVTTARFLYGQEFEFKPRFKLWIATNYKIIVRGTDYGIWRRMRIIPFKVKFEGDKVDKKLTEKLLLELPQILGWAVKGCIKYIKEGFGEMPKQITDEIGNYKQEMDIVTSFFNSCCKIKESGMEKASDIYKEYAEWAKIGHEYCMTQSKFGIELSKRFEKKNIGGYVYYKGFILKKNDTSYVYTKEG